MATGRRKRGGNNATHRPEREPGIGRQSEDLRRPGVRGGLKRSLGMASGHAQTTIAKTCGLDAATQGNHADDRGFTLIELMVVISIVSLLMAILLSTLGRVRKLARATLCLSNVRQLGVAFHTAAADEGIVMDSDDPSWWHVLGAYSDSNDVFLCPEARKPGLPPYLGLSPFEAWEATLHYPGGHIVCSFGANYWLTEVSDMREKAEVLGWKNVTDFQAFRKRYWYWSGRDLNTPSIVPLLGDCSVNGAQPEEVDYPPACHGEFMGHRVATPWNRAIDQMKVFCLDRHGSGKANMTFMDGSSRPVGRKELWTLKWYRGCPAAGPWTKAGGGLPSDWPEWMRKFKDY